MGNGKKAAARFGDIGSQHKGYVPTPVMMGSTNVVCNGLMAARDRDPLVPHIRPKSPPHPRAVKGSASTVKVNGKKWARLGDAVNCGGKIVTGSPDVFIGNGPKGGNAVTPEEWKAVMSKLMDSGVDTSTPYKRQQMEGAEAVKFRGREGGLASWAEYYKHQVNTAEAKGESMPVVPPEADLIEQEGFAHAQQHIAEEKAQQAAFNRYQNAWLLNAAREAPDAWQRDDKVQTLLGQRDGESRTRVQGKMREAAASSAGLSSQGVGGATKPVKTFSATKDAPTLEAPDVASGTQGLQPG
ncbi:MAG: PAAR domain-containing protein [Aquisalimonadaceae bacterium]